MKGFRLIFACLILLPLLVIVSLFMNMSLAILKYFDVNRTQEYAEQLGLKIKEDFKCFVKGKKTTEE